MMTNKYVVFDRDAFADERVARNLAAGADDGILLNFNKATDARLIPHRTAVKVSEAEYFYGTAQADISSDAVKRFRTVLVVVGVGSCFSLLRHKELCVVVRMRSTFATRN